MCSLSHLRRGLLLAALVAAVGSQPATSQAACCYFSAKNADILQPAQKVFITWNPEEKVETFTVQPKFEGNALDFGMVIPTPSQPKLHEMPRDFFKHLAVYTIMKKREFPNSQLLPKIEPMGFGFGGGFAGMGGMPGMGMMGGGLAPDPTVVPPSKKPAIKIL